MIAECEIQIEFRDGFNAFFFEKVLNDDLCIEKFVFDVANETRLEDHFLLGVFDSHDRDRAIETRDVHATKFFVHVFEFLDVRFDQF